MKQEDIIKAIEGVTEIVASLTSSGIVLSTAIVAIKGIIGMVVGQTLEGPEYAAAVQRGIDRNRQKIGDRINELESQ